MRRRTASPGALLSSGRSGAASTLLSPQDA